MHDAKNHAYCAAVYSLSHSNGKCGLCATKHWQKKKKKKRRNVKREKSLLHKHQKLIWHISEPLKPGSLTDRQGACCSRQGWKTDTVKVSAGGARGSCWSSCMWLRGRLIWLCDVSRWPGDTIQGLWRTAALAATTNEQFAYVWPLASERHSINHTSAMAAVGFGLRFSPTRLPSFARLSLRSISLSCFLSSPALRVFLCFPSKPPFFFPSPSPPPPPRTHAITSSLLRISRHLPSQWLAQTVGSQRQRNAFTLRGSFASHSWCGGGSACTHRGRGRGWCWRVTTVRLSSTLVPLGRTCTVGRHFMNNLPYLRLIFNGYILIECSPPFVQTKQHHTQGALSHFWGGGGCGLHKFKGMMWNMTSSTGWCNLRAWWESLTTIQLREDRGSVQRWAAIPCWRSEPSLSKHISGAEQERKVII